MKDNLKNMSNEKLWKLFPIIIVPYNPVYREYFQNEKQLLKDILGEGIIRTHHIGSTAIENLLSKPIIDILLEISDKYNLQKLITSLELHDYIFIKQPLQPSPHMMFVKGYTIEGFKDQVFHIHIRYVGDWNELYFRDYLQKYPEIARDYAALKLELAVKYKYNRDAYTDSKSYFINHYTQVALNEFKNRYCYKI